MSQPLSNLTLTFSDLLDAQKFARYLVDSMTLPLTVGLVGTLGSGKTQLTKFICEALNIPLEMVTSPTYVLVHRYIGNRLVFHIDLYRLQTVNQAWDLGLDEFFATECLTIIEWADKFVDYLPDEHLLIELAVQADGTRLINVRAHGDRSTTMLAEIRRQWEGYL